MLNLSIRTNAVQRPPKWTKIEFANDQFRLLPLTAYHVYSMVFVSSVKFIMNIGRRDAEVVQLHVSFRD